MKASKIEREKKKERREEIKKEEMKEKRKEGGKEGGKDGRKERRKERGGEGNKEEREEGNYQHLYLSKYGWLQHFLSSIITFIREGWFDARIPIWSHRNELELKIHHQLFFDNNLISFLQAQLVVIKFSSFYSPSKIQPNYFDNTTVQIC